MEENLKANKIVDELLHFFITHHSTTIRTGIDFVARGFYVQIQGELVIDAEELEYFSMLLNEDRNPTLEDYQEELLGTSHHELLDYHLVGLMVDDVEISYDNNFLDVKVFRKNLNLAP